MKFPVETRPGKSTATATKVRVKLSYIDSSEPSQEAVLCCFLFNWSSLSMVADPHDQSNVLVTNPQLSSPQVVLRHPGDRLHDPRPYSIVPWAASRLAM